jgi:predicted permease
MRWFEQFRMRIGMLFRRGRAAERLDAELRFHLDQQIAENIAAGMSAEEARHAALREFGNPAALRDQARETWSWTGVESLLRDVRIAARTLGRTPGFALTAIVIVALGIGATVTMFTVVHSVLLKPLPFEDPDRLVRIYEADSHDPGHNHVAVAGADFLDWQKQAHSIDQMALMYTMNGGYNLSGSSGQLPEFVEAQVADWNLFPILSVRPAAGRLFTVDDDRAGADATAVLTWGLWKRRYGGDPAIVGQKILLDAKPYTVIGVLPAWFSYPHSKVQLWTAVRHEMASWPGFATSHGAHNFRVVARLKPGVTIARAKAELDSIQANIRKQFPEGPIFDATNVMPLLESDVHKVKGPLYALFGATGCLLLIACLNIAGLLVARAAARRNEAAIRTALGGSRARLIREQLVESVLLTLAGGVLGLLFALLTVHWLVTIRSDLPRVDGIHLDGVAVLFAAGVVLLCGLVAGLIAALSVNDKQVLRALQAASRSQAGSHGRARLRRVLLSLEVGLTVVLLISAGLLLRSYQRLRSVELGCATDNVLTMGINLPEARYKTHSQITEFYEQLLDRIRALPGVAGAGLNTVLPGTGSGRDDAFTITENPPLPKGKYLDASMRSVDPGYFAAMQIPIVRGRSFLPNQRLKDANVAIVTPAFVREFFPNTDPLGKHIDDGNFDDPHKFEIVGVAADTLEDVSRPAQPTMYFPLYGGSESYARLAVRTKSDAASFALPIQKIIAQMDRDLPVSDILTMDQIVGKSTLDASFDALLLTVLATLSLILAAVGLFGVLSYIVTQRRSEIGIRMALGEQRGQVLGLMLVDGLRPAIYGLVLGLIASAGAVKLIRSMLYGSKPVDSVVFVAVAVALLLVAALACAVPAWRASRLDPMEALRTE